jgi:hypothetical protein
MNFENEEYNIGDIIYNTWSDRFYVVVDFSYKNASKFHTIKDLINDKIILDEWLYSKRLLWNKGSFNGYEVEYRMSSKSEAVSKFRKNKIKNILDSK